MLCEQVFTPCEPVTNATGDDITEAWALQFTGVSYEEVCLCTG